MALSLPSFGRVVVVALCGAGAWISAELVREHAGPWPGTDPKPGIFGRPCGDGSPGSFDCAVVRASDWSAFDITLPTVTSAGTVSRRRVVIPVAFVGLAYFVFLGSWFLLAGPPGTWGRWYVVPLMTVVAGLCASVVLLWILLVRLDSACTDCMITHAINGLLVVGVLALRPRRGDPWGEGATGRLRGDLGARPRVQLAPAAALRIMGFAVLVIVGLWAVRGAKLETRAEVAKLLPYKEIFDQWQTDPAFLVREFHAQPRQAFLEQVWPRSAKPDDSVPTVTVFSDFRCPQCACFAANWHAVYARRWKGPVRLSMRHLPLDRACNESVTTDVHSDACEASYAAEAARLQGGDEAFRKMHDLLFATSRRGGREPYAKLAGQIGLDAGRLVADMKSDKVRRTIADDVALAAALGVHQTPSVFLNGRRVPEFCLHNPVFWEAVSLEFQQTTRRTALSAAVSEAEAPTDGHAMASSAAVEP